MNSAKKKTPTTTSESRRSFGKSIAGAIMTLPFVATLAKGQDKNKEKGGRPRQKSPKTIPPIIIKASKDGMFEILSRFPLGTATGPVDGRYKYKYPADAAAQLDLSSIEIVGKGTTTKRFLYKNETMNECRIDFWMAPNYPQPASANPNVTLIKCIGAGCHGIDILTDTQFVITVESEAGMKYRNKYPAGASQLDKVSGIRVSSGSSILLEATDVVCSNTDNGEYITVY